MYVFVLCAVDNFTRKHFKYIQSPKTQNISFNYLPAVTNKCVSSFHPGVYTSTTSSRR